MKRLVFLSVIAICCAFISPNQNSSYMFIMLRPIPHCDGKCNKFELVEYPMKSAEECKRQEDSCRAKYGNLPTYYTIAPGEAAVYYKYNKFVTNCDCKILGVYKSTSVAQATEEMNKKVAEEQVKKPKSYHNYEIYSSWPR